MNLNIKYVFNITTIILLTFSCNSYKTKHHHSNQSVKKIQKASTEDSKISWNEISDSIITNDLNKVINYSDKNLNIGSPESLLGNFICDISMFSIKKNKNITHHPDFCVFNNGIFKAPIAKGEVTIADIYSVFPTNHELVIVKVDPKNLSLFLNYILKESLAKDSDSSGVSTSGVRLKISEEKKIRRCMVNTMEINKNNSYYLLTSYQLINSQNGMNFLKNSVMEKTNLMLKEVVLKYIHQISLNSITINAELDGRITIIK